MEEHAPTENEPYILYGDLVVITGSFQRRQNDDISGVLSAIGFTDHRIFFQNLPFNIFHTRSLQNLHNEENLALIRNYRDFVFQIWPRLNYEAHKEYRKHLKDRAKYMKKKKSDNLKDREIANEYENTLAKLYSRTREEKTANDMMIETERGKTVCYGSEVLFMHVDSGLFMTGKVTTSESDKSAYKFELSKDYSSRMIFKIVPKYQVCQEGDPINYDDDILLLNDKLNCYVNFTRDCMIDYDLPIKAINKEAIPPQPYKTTEPRKMDINSMRYEAHLSHYKETVWRMLFHSREAKQNIEDETTMKCVHGGTLVRLHHMELRGYLAADICYAQENPEVYVRTYEGEHHEEKYCANELWEIEHVSIHGRGEEIMAITQDDIQERHLYRLRHYLTGRVLVLTEVQMDQKRIIPVLAQEKDEKAVRDLGNCVSFIPTVYQSHTHVVHGNSYSIAFSDQKFFLRTVPINQSLNKPNLNHYTTQGLLQSQKKMHHHSTDPGLPVTDSPEVSNPKKDTKNLASFFTPLKDSEFGVKRRPTYVDLQKSAEHAFYVEVVDDEEKNNVLFVGSAVLRLNHFRDILKAQQTSLLSSEYLKKVLDTLKELIFFVANIEDKTVDPLECEGFPKPECQRLLKDLKLIEVLTDILFYPFALNIFPNKIPEDLMTIFRLSYTLIRHTIKEYRPNELYASQWLDLFIYQSMSSDMEGIDLNAEPTLTELIDNNKRILEHKIKPKTITEFVEKLKVLPKEKFVNLLRALTVCNGEPMLANQDAISRMIFEDEEARDLICYRIAQQADGKLYIVIPTSKEFISLESLDDKNELYAYFISLVYLLADLCLGRNYVAIDGLKGIYTYEICYNILSNQKYNTAVRTAFAKLFIHLWIDKTYHQIKLPNYLVTWEEINKQNSEDIFKYNNVSNDFQTFKAYLLKYFQRIADQGFLIAFQEDGNKMTLVFLENVEILAKFGFYSNLKDIADVLRPLLSLLNGANDVTTQEEFDSRNKHKEAHNSRIAVHFMQGGHDPYALNERYKEDNRTQVLMQIKMKILTIVNIFMDFFNDLHMRRFLLEFKKEEESQIVKTKKSLGSEKNPNEWIENNYKDVAFSVEHYTSVPLAVIMIDLLLYEKKELQKQAFETLYKEHTKRLALKDMISSVYLVEDKETMKNINIIKTIGGRVQDLAERTEKWYGKHDEEAEKISAEVLEIVEKLAGFLTTESVQSLSKTGKIAGRKASPEEEKIIGNFDVDEIFEGGTGPNPDYQKVMRYLDTYQGILEILNFDLKGRFDSDEVRPAIAQKILKACVKFLARFVAKDRNNQEIVGKYAPLLLKMLKKDPSLGLESIIGELFLNNKALLNDKSALENYLNVVVKTIDSLHPDNPRRSKLLLTINTLMKYRDNVIKKNQTLVVNFLSRKEFKTVLLDFSNEKIWAELKNLLDGYHSKIFEKKFPIVLPGELDYLVSLLDIMAVSSEDKNAASESKCQFLFPMKVLKQIYSIAGQCYYIKYAVMYFLFHVYMETEREMREEDADLTDLFLLMTDDLRVLGEQGRSNYDIFVNKGLINSKVIEEILVYDGIIPNLTLLFMNKLTKDLPEYEKLLSSIMTEVKKFKLGTKGYHRQKEMSKLYFILGKHHRSKIRMLGLEEELKSQLVHFEGIQMQDHKEQLKKPENERLVRNKTMLGRFENRSSSLGREQSMFMDEESHADRLDAKIESLEADETRTFSKNVEKEFDSFIEKIVNIEKITEKQGSIAYEKVVKALIELIERDDEGLDDDLRAEGLRIFRKIIEREAPNDKPAAEWETDDWDDVKGKIIRKQNELTSFGVIEMLCKLFYSTTNRKIIEECVLLSIALLIGGNLKAQETFLEYMKNDTQNDFMQAIQKLITTEIESLKMDMIRVNERYAKKNLFGEDADAEANQQEGPSKQLLNTERFMRTDIGESDTQIIKESKDSIDILVKLFRLLQLLCEGHNLTLQNHLRLQTVKNGTTNPRSHDFISSSAAWFGSFIRFANTDSLPFGDQLLEFLIEAVQGPCIDNQKTLVNSKIINFCMDYATIFNNNSEQKRRGFTSDEQLEDIRNSVTKAMKLLYSLLEGNVDESIVEEMSHQIDFNFLMDKLANDFKTFCDKLSIRVSASLKIPTIIEVLKNTPDSFNDSILESFGVFILLLTLADHNKSIDELIKKGFEEKSFNLLQRKAYHFFKSNIASIEIIFNKQLIKVYFPIHPTTRFLTRKSRNTLMAEVKRESPNEKIFGLLNARDDLFDEMEHLARLNRWWIRISAQKLTFFRDASTTIAFIINLLILFTYYRDYNTDPETGRNGMLQTSYYEIFGGDEHSALKISNIIKFFGILQIITASLMMIFWLVLRVPLLLRKRWRELVEKQKLTHIEENNFEDDDEEVTGTNNDSHHNEETIIDPSTLKTSATMQILLTKGPDCEIFKKGRKRNFGNLWTKFVYYWTNLHFILGDGGFRYQAFYLIVSILGLPGPELVYSLQLLDVVDRFPNLRNVVRSVTLNTKQLLMTAVVGLICLYIYTIIGFWFFDDLYFDHHKSSERICTSMLQCFIITLDYGPRSAGGIGDRTVTPSYESHTRLRWWSKVVWEFLFFIVINVIFMNLLLGIIIETFAALRDHKEEIDRDMSSKCYICDLERWKLDKNGKGFLNHIKYNHHLWNYLHYLFLLKKKDPTEFNGIESYVASKLDDKIISWFPNKKALELNYHDDEAEVKEAGGDHHHGDHH